ncbi:hypothetical protein AAG906_022925 [Vitis piasezkii]
MAEGETTKMDPQNSIEEPNHPVGESVAPEHKKPKHHQPCEDRAEPHNPFDASHAESQSQSPVTPDESNHDETESQTQSPPTVVDATKEPIKTEALASSEDSGRDLLKRHRVEVAGRVSRIMSARAALMAEGRRPNSSGLRIENRC